MFTTKNNAQIQKVGNWVKQRYEPYENGLAIAILIVFMLHSAVDINIAVFKILLLLSLAMIYYILGFAVSAVANEFQRFVEKIASIASSVGIVGILFRIQSYPGNEIMLTVGGFSLALAMLFIFILNKTGKGFQVLPSRVMIRIAIIASLTLSLRFASNEVLQDFGIKIPEPLEQVK